MNGPFLDDEIFSIACPCLRNIFGSKCHWRECNSSRGKLKSNCFSSSSEKTCISVKDCNEDSSFFVRNLKQRRDDHGGSTQEMSTKVTEIVTATGIEANLETETL
ncbi:hypothetical protein RUM44_001770 [Polyplax serrata]|uniref:Uncharacterized protein n=1 Tax=Polyplax serrata TaxID=468196 RepID=A0ABR1AMS4_POLSC